MRILSVRVKNVRMHEDCTVEFDRERTVVAGPNESGKSTLVDAIERVLCYPHRSSADNLDGFKPRAGGGTPEVCLRFERHGRTYEILKIFKGPQSVARLTDQDGVAWTGDEAEERLRACWGSAKPNFAPHSADGRTSGPVRARRAMIPRRASPSAPPRGLSTCGSRAWPARP